MRLTPLLTLVLAAACTPAPVPPPSSGPDAGTPPETASWKPIPNKDMGLFAGNADGPGTTDGALTEARFGLPRAVATNGLGALYVADQTAGTLRRISANGTVMTWAGKAGDNRTVDGMRNMSRLNSPQAVAFDEENNVFVLEANHVLRRFGGDETVTTIAGKAGIPGSDDGPGADARFADPAGLAIAADGTMYVSDSANHTIREVTKEGVVSTLAGNAGEAGADDGFGEAARFSFPQGLVLLPNGQLLVADSGNHVIRAVKTTGDGRGEVTTMAGRAGESGDADGAANEARFNGLRGLSLGPDGALYVADTFNNTIRRLGPTGEVTTIAGPEGFSLPSGVVATGTAEATVVYACDSGNATIRRISGESVTIHAGSAVQMATVDGTGTSARFEGVGALVVDADGSLLAVDPVAHVIRRLTAEGVVTTAFGAKGEPDLVDGKGPAARFSRPSSIARAPDGSLFVADSDNHRIRKIAADGTVSTYAGAPGGRGGGGFSDGPAIEAQFDSPQGVAVDAQGNVFVADARNQRIRRISTDGQVTTVAGDGLPGATNGAALQARFNFPQALLFDQDGRLLVADTQNHLIRVITFGAETTVDTLAGNTPTDDGDPIPGFEDGTGTAAKFDAPLGMALEKGGSVIVADSSNHALRRLTKDGVVTTIAGTKDAMGLVEGALPGTLPDPQGVAFVADGLLAVSFGTGVLLVKVP